MIVYSLVYVADALDITGKLRSGAGFTCSTYVLGVFDALSMPLVDVSTWEKREKEDQAFKDTYLENAYFGPKRLLGSGTTLDLDIARALREQLISDEAATRIQFEEPDFRVKPAEVCGAATVGKYPAKYKQAVKGAKRVAARIKELGKGTP